MSTFFVEIDLCQTDNKRAAFHAWYLDDEDVADIYVDGKGRQVVATTIISVATGIQVTTDSHARHGKYIGIVFKIPPEDHGFPTIGLKG